MFAQSESFRSLLSRMADDFREPSVRDLISVSFYSFHRMISHVVPRNGNGESSLIAFPSCSRKLTGQPSRTVILRNCDLAFSPIQSATLQHALSAQRADKYLHNYEKKINATLSLSRLLILYYWT